MSNEEQTIALVVFGAVLPFIFYIFVWLNVEFAKMKLYKKALIHFLGGPVVWFFVGIPTAFDFLIKWLKS